ncbi:MAG TPA: C40 family peptidase, partial [Chloroflexia bacterium]|nr:C40 family peptidase [Chloroflexia bacterium]
VPVADLRAEPRDTAERINQALLATPLMVLATHSDPGGAGWLRVRLPDYEGWIRQEQVLCGVPPLAPPQEVCVAVLSTPLTLLEPTGTPGRRTILAYMGTRLPPTPPAAPPGAPVTLQLPDGTRALVDAAAVRPVAAPPSGAAPEILATAHTFLGTPYLWGGMTCQGIDCSGFVQIIYRVHGYTLPRDADQQFRQIPEQVGPAEWQPGDLIFYGHPPARVIHVMLYLGEERVIHAKGGVQVLVQSTNPAHPDYHARPDHYLGARRALPAHAQIGATGGL